MGLVAPPNIHLFNSAQSIPQEHIAPPSCLFGLALPLAPLEIRVAGRRGRAGRVYGSSNVLDHIRALLAFPPFQVSRFHAVRLVLPHASVHAAVNVPKLPSAIVPALLLLGRASVSIVAKTTEEP